MSGRSQDGDALSPVSFPMSNRINNNDPFNSMNQSQVQ